MPRRKPGVNPLLVPVGFMLDYFTWKRSNVAASSYKNYEHWVKRFIEFHPDIEHIGLDDIARFKDFLQAKGYSPKNIQYGLSIVRDYIGFQVNAYGLDFPLKLFRIKVERSNSHHPLTIEEYRTMIHNTPATSPQGVQRRLMLQMLWDTGMRGGELLRLRISDLRKLKHALIENEKNYRSRLVAWSEDTTFLLSIYLLIREEIESSEDYLFVSLFRKNPAKMQLTMRGLQIIVKDASKGLEEKISPHSFRHAFVHRKLDEGKPITTVAQMLGHSTSLNVMTYSQRSGPEMQEAWGIK